MRIDLYSVQLNKSYEMYAKHWSESHSKVYAMSNFIVPDWVGDAVVSAGQAVTYIIPLSIKFIFSFKFMLIRG